MPAGRNKGMAVLDLICDFPNEVFKLKTIGNMKIFPYLPCPDAHTSQLVSEGEELIILERSFSPTGAPYVRVKNVIKRLFGYMSLQSSNYKIVYEPNNDIF